MRPYVIKHTDSITKKRLVFRRSGVFVMTSIYEYLFPTIWVVAMILMIRDNFSFDNSVSIVMLGLSFSFTIWALSGYLFLNKLVAISPKSNESINDIVIETLKLHFPDFEIDNSSKKIIIAKKERTLISWGNEINCLIESNKFYINITTIGNYDLRSPFHAPFNYLKCKRFKLEIEA